MHTKIGLTFAACLRSILRHDPDVILIGEMRDLETAEAAIQASLTGHLVFSTLHTNDAPSAFTRLIDMGIEPFLVASTVEGVMAQRLVRTICPECKTQLRAADEHPDRAAGLPRVDVNTTAAADCVQGHRLPVVPQDGLPRPNRHLRADGDQRRDPGAGRAARQRRRHPPSRRLKEGMITLRQDGWRKVHERA